MALPPEFKTPQFEKGLAIRRAVLGAEYVDRSVQNVDEFMKPLQKLVTEYCWGEVWSRPGLDRKTRSLLNLAMLAALNRPHELRLHTRGALINGVTVEEIQEVMLQVAIYVGVPAGLDSSKAVSEAIKAYDGKGRNDAPGDGATTNGAAANGGHL
jgi:4-carboxymuconolactone decarboxylase